MLIQIRKPDSLYLDVVYDVDVFIAAMRENLGGDITFHEAFNKTRRILNITVSSSTNFEMPRLLNYLTAPNVVIWSAVYVLLLLFRHLCNFLTPSTELRRARFPMSSAPFVSRPKSLAPINSKTGIQQITVGLTDQLRETFQCKK